MVVTEKKTIIGFEEAVDTLCSAINLYGHSMDERKVGQFLGMLVAGREAREQGEYFNGMMYFLGNLSSYTPDSRNSLVWCREDGLYLDFPIDPITGRDPLTGNHHPVQNIENYTLDELRRLDADKYHDGAHTVNGVAQHIGAQIAQRLHPAAYDSSPLSHAIHEGIVASGTGTKSAYKATVDSGRVLIHDGKTSPYVSLFLPGVPQVDVVGFDWRRK